MNKEELQKIQDKAWECLDLHFPKGDKRRGDALVVLAIFQILGREEMKYINNSINIKSTSLEVEE